MSFEGAFPSLYISIFYWTGIRNWRIRRVVGDKNMKRVTNINRIAESTRWSKDKRAYMDSCYGLNNFIFVNLAKLKFFLPPILLYRQFMMVPLLLFLAFHKKKELIEVFIAKLPQFLQGIFSLFLPFSEPEQPALLVFFHEAHWSQLGSNFSPFFLHQI